MSLSWQHWVIAAFAGVYIATGLLAALALFCAALYWAVVR